MTEPSTDLMEGITTKTKRATIYARLQEASDTLSRMQTIARTRRKWKAQNPEDQHSVVVTASEQDWIDSLEFLHDLQDVLPPALLRLMHGGRTMFMGHLEEEEDEPKELESGN